MKNKHTHTHRMYKSWAYVSWVCVVLKTKIRHTPNDKRAIEKDMEGVRACEYVMRAAWLLFIYLFHSACAFVCIVTRITWALTLCLRPLFHINNYFDRKTHSLHSVIVFCWFWFDRSGKLSVERDSFECLVSLSLSHCHLIVIISLLCLHIITISAKRWITQSVEYVFR